MNSQLRKIKNSKNMLKLILCSGTVYATASFAATSTSKSDQIDSDNSGVNKRDRADKTLTADDQARGTDSDVEVTRLIRKDIVDRDLSSSAKNIKIITMNGDVTLRGPIESVTEKNVVQDIAQRHVKKNHKVNNYIEVKSE